MLGTVLTLDHRRLEELINDFLQNPNPSLYEEIRRAYVNHIYWEEEFLFKKINNTSLLAIIKGLEGEHASMWMLLDQVKEFLDANDVENAENKMSAVLRVLLEHDGAEEGSVYPELDTLEEEEQAKLMLEEMKLAVVPSDWRCKLCKNHKLKDNIYHERLSFKVSCYGIYFLFILF